jgi:hypothetical protein
MPFRFRRSIKILPGLKINISKGGLSTSIGGRGHSVNIGKRGVRTTIGLPGTGLSYSTQTVKFSNPPQGKTHPEVQPVLEASPIPEPEAFTAENQISDPVLPFYRRTWFIAVTIFALPICLGGVCFLTLGPILRAPTPTPTSTFTSTITLTPTITDTPTITETPTITDTPTITWTPSITPTITRTFTITRTPTRTRTATRTSSMTRTPKPYIPPAYIPPPPSGHPSGTSGQCNDGSYTYAVHKQGACSHHGGIAQWWGP